MTRWFSLRRRLLALLLGGMSACWLATLAWTYVDAHHEIDEMFDAQLAQSAEVLLALGSHEGDDDGIEEITGGTHRYQRQLMFQLWSQQGRLILRSPNAPPAPLAAADGYSDGVIDDGKHSAWRYYSQWNAQRNLRVQVGENHHLRDELVGHIAARLLLPALLGLPLLGAWVWLATRRGLAPLDALARQIGSRDPARLQPVVPQTAPAELRPLLDALNGLFGRVERTLANERRFTADAAHELRTPLAALAVQAQVAARAQDEVERNHALERLAAGTTRAAHLVDQLLTLARLDPELGQRPTARVRLDALAEEVCADHGTQALAKDIALELDAVPAEVNSDGELLRILLRNLVDNAIRYTPGGGAVHVTVAEAAGSARLVVADNGPGIPAAERERVFERFSRLAGQEIAGSGLGLSIVRRIAELHAARVTLAAGSDGRGLAVAVDFTTPAGAARPGSA